jgi:hypothetical protein
VLPQLGGYVRLLINYAIGILGFLLVGFTIARHDQPSHRGFNFKVQHILKKVNEISYKKVKEISYDSAVCRGRSFEAHYSTNTGVELRVQSELDGLEPQALASVDTDRYAKLWGLAMFGHLFWPLLPTRVHIRV